MTKQHIITWVILMILTVTSGLVSQSVAAFVVPVILLLAAFKFIGVAFNFMEMKKANIFWKILIVGYLVVFVGIVYLAL